MSEHITYVANGGQTYQPCQDNVKVPFASYGETGQTESITA